MILRPSFPAVVDDSLLLHFRACPRKAFNESFRHFKSQSKSVHLHAGAAFATGLEAARRAYYEGCRTPDESIAIGIGALVKAYGYFDCPEDSPKTWLRMAQALDYYFEVWPLASDSARPLELASGNRAIEFSFAEPLPIQHPETGDPLIYSGRSDMIVDLAQGHFIEDDKTASQLGAKWHNTWELRSQFTGYCWAAGRIGRRVDGVLVRGVAILKNGFSSAQHITYRSGFEIERWLAQTLRDLERMVECWKSGFWDVNLGDSCASYGGCGFQQVCKSNNPDVWLENYFERREWNPLTRVETTLDREASVDKGYLILP